AQGHPGVGIVGAHHQNQGVKKDQVVGQAGEGKGAAGGQQQGQRQDHRQGLHHPGEPVVGLDPRPQQGGQGGGQQEGQLPAGGHQSSPQRGTRPCSTPNWSRMRATTKSTRSSTVSGFW